MMSYSMITSSSKPASDFFDASAWAYAIEIWKSLFLRSISLSEERDWSWPDWPFIKLVEMNLCYNCNPSTSDVQECWFAETQECLRRILLLQYFGDHERKSWPWVTHPTYLAQRLQFFSSTKTKAMLQLLCMDPNFSASIRNSLATTLTTGMCNVHQAFYTKHRSLGRTGLG